MITHLNIRDTELSGLSPSHMAPYQGKNFGSWFIHVFQNQRLWFLNPLGIDSKRSVVVFHTMNAVHRRGRVFLFFVAVRGLWTPFLNLLSRITERKIKTIGRQWDCGWFVHVLQDLSPDVKRNEGKKTRMTIGQRIPRSETLFVFFCQVGCGMRRT
jgi:hypothetical protein